MVPFVRVSSPVRGHTSAKKRASPRCHVLQRREGIWFDVQAEAFHDAIQSCYVILRYCCMIAAQRVHNVLSRRIVQEAANSARLVSLCIAVQENVAVRLSGKKGTVFTETRKESGACCKPDRNRWGESQERLRRRRCSGLGDARKKPIVWQDIAQHHNKIVRFKCDTSERMGGSGERSFHAVEVHRVARTQAHRPFRNRARAARLDIKHNGKSLCGL